jgi:hypothetical protein
MGFRVQISTRRPIILTGGVHDFRQSLQANTGIFSELGHGFFLPRLSFIIHYRVTIPHSTAWRKLTAGVVKTIVLFYFIIIYVYMSVNSI